jgi:hypothetical protein
MAKQDDKLHTHIAAGLSDTRVSPAVLALKMLQENVYVNESLLQYFVNYINTMANAKVLPLHLQEVQGQCQALQISLQELGLLGTQGRVQATSNEFLSL